MYCGVWTKATRAPKVTFAGTGASSAPSEKMDLVPLRPLEPLIPLDPLGSLPPFPLIKLANGEASSYSCSISEIWLDVGSVLVVGGGWWFGRSAVRPMSAWARGCVGAWVVEAVPNVRIVERKKGQALPRHRLPSLHWAAACLEEEGERGDEEGRVGLHVVVQDQHVLA